MTDSPEDRLLRAAEAAATRLLETAAVAAAKLRAEAANGNMAELRADIKGLTGDVAAIASSLLTLQRNHLRVLGAASLCGGVLIFVLSRAVGL